MYPFSYLQARLQARHGARPDGARWRHLESVQGLAPFLEAARGTGLRPWLESVAPHTPAHEIERLLRGEWHRHVAEVAGWVPHPWHAAVDWTGTLAELPALTHLIAGRPALPWMEQDPLLRPLLAEQPALRRAALEESAYAPLLAPGRPPELAWAQEWRRRWPSRPLAGPDGSRALAPLADRFTAFLARPLPLAAAESARPRLNLLFRRHAGTAAAPFIHLALDALDLERLRGALMVRALFGRPQGEGS